MKPLEKIKLLSSHFFKMALRAEAKRALIFALIFYMFFIYISYLGYDSAQAFFSTSINVASFIIYLVAIFSTCTSFLEEIKKHTLPFLLTKPISATDIILAKWISVNLLVFIFLSLFYATSHILGFILYKRYFFVFDISLASLFLGSFILSAFTLMVTVYYPRITTAIGIAIFSLDIFERILRILKNSTPPSVLWQLVRKAGLYVLYLLYYLFPSYNAISLEVREVILKRFFFYSYAWNLAYAVMGTASYLLVAIFLFKRKSKTYGQL